VVRAYLHVAPPGSGRGLVPRTSWRPWSRVLPPTRRPGLHPIRPARCGRGGGGSGCLGVSTVGLTPPVATEWIADSGASLQMRVSFLLSDLLTPLVLPSWSVMALVFRSLLWVQLTVLFVSLMSLLLLR
jgi:hypothetical protein